MTYDFVYRNPVRSITSAIIPEVFGTMVDCISYRFRSDVEAFTTTIADDMPFIHCFSDVFKGMTVNLDDFGTDVTAARAGEVLYTLDTTLRSGGLNTFVLGMSIRVNIDGLRVAVGTSGTGTLPLTSFPFASTPTRLLPYWASPGRMAMA